MASKPEITIKRFRWVLCIASMVNGLLAGGNVYRYVIEVPAWKHLDVSSWAVYSRYADLGNGVVLFPAEAIGGTLLLIVASVMVARNKVLFKAAAWPVYVATLFALLGIVFTFFAAPQMLHLQSVAGDPAQVQQIFHRFHFWGSLRAIVQVLAFIASAWALMLY